MAALFRADLEQMIYWNALLIPLAVILMAAGFCRPWKVKGWVALGVVVCLFGVLRNLPFYLLY